MLAKASAESPAIRWVEASVNGWTKGAPVDLVSSNAPLHWVRGHEHLFPHLAAQVAPGGIVAVRLRRRTP